MDLGSTAALAVARARDGDGAVAMSTDRIGQNTDALIK